jgi:pimeloyl-ACP methyl ester carboxylesterase
MLLASHPHPRDRLLRRARAALPSGGHSSAVLASAISWLRVQPHVDPNRVWILSGSRGTEAELLVAGNYPKLVHGIVAEAPSAFANGAVRGNRATAQYGAPAWTFNSKPIADNTPLPANRIHGPALLISGRDDKVWLSDLAADQVMSELPHGAERHVHVNYPDAGHLVLGIPYTPIIPSELADGGTSAGINVAHASDWPAMIAFIDQN